MFPFKPVMGAQVRAEEMAGAGDMEFAFGVDTLFVEGGGVVVVAVHGVDVPY